MPQPASTLRFVKRRSERNGRGASLRMDSQKGNRTRQTQPTTIMAIMLALCQCLFAVAANVRGIKIKEKAADSNRRPIMSNSYHKRLKPPATLWPFLRTSWCQRRSLWIDSENRGDLDKHRFLIATKIWRFTMEIGSSARAQELYVPRRWHVTRRVVYTRRHGISNLLSHGDA